MLKCFSLFVFEMLYSDIWWHCLMIWVSCYFYWDYFGLSDCKFWLISNLVLVLVAFCKHFISKKTFAYDWMFFGFNFRDYLRFVLWDYIIHLKFFTFFAFCLFLSNDKLFRSKFTNRKETWCLSALHQRTLRLILILLCQSTIICNFDANYFLSWIFNRFFLMQS